MTTDGTQDLYRKKREDEIRIAEQMIRIYCHGRHHTADGLCDSCRKLLEYTAERTMGCPRMAEKTFCSACPVHCYKPDKREEIRVVMRYAGPRMLFHHPVLLIRHICSSRNESR